MDSSRPNQDYFLLPLGAWGDGIFVSLSIGVVQRKAEGKEMGTQETAFMVESCGDFSFETLFRVPETVGSPGSEPSRLRGLGQYLATNYAKTKRLPI